MIFELTMSNVLTVVGLLLAVLLLLVRGAFWLHEKRLNERFERAEKRIGLLESDLYNRINRMSEDLSKLSGEFAAMRRTLELLHEFLLTGGRQP